MKRKTKTALYRLVTLDKLVVFVGLALFVYGILSTPSPTPTNLNVFLNEIGVNYSAIIGLTILSIGFILSVFHSHTFHKSDRESKPRNQS